MEKSGSRWAQRERSYSHDWSSMKVRDCGAPSSSLGRWIQAYRILTGTTGNKRVVIPQLFLFAIIRNTKFSEQLNFVLQLEN